MTLNSTPITPALVAEHGLTIPPEAVAVFRALATLEGTLAQLDPGFDIVAEARSFAESQLEPAALRHAARDELVAALGGTNEAVEHAAEIAMEHNLGMTCDPVAGYVQVPCIERCAFGAVKAWVAFMVATNEIAARHRVDLDTTIKTLAQTGKDMSIKYKETSEAGLAANLVLC